MARHVNIQQYSRLPSWKHSHSQTDECNPPLGIKSLQDTRLKQMENRHSYSGTRISSHGDNQHLFRVYADDYMVPFYDKMSL